MLILQFFLFIFQITVQNIQADTSLHSHDICLTFMLLGFIRKSVENKFILAVDWKRVDQHMEKVEKALKAGTRINLDPDQLRWTPIVSGHDLFRSPYKQRGESLSSPLKSPLSSPGSTATTSRQKQKQPSKDTSTSSDEEEQENLPLKKKPRKSPKKKARRNLSGECKGLDGGDALNNINNFKKRITKQQQDLAGTSKNGSKSSNRLGKSRKLSENSSHNDEDDADDEQEMDEIEVTQLASPLKTPAAAITNNKTTKDIPKDFKDENNKIKPKASA